jgi:hypothetical protein
MDELIIQAESSIPGEQFSPVINRLAATINTIEQNIENDRDVKEKISSNIERLGSTPEREGNLKRVKDLIATRRTELNRLRKKLQQALQQYAVADGTVATQMALARALRDEIKREFRNELSTADYNAIWSQLPDELIDITTDSPRAGRERKALRKLKNVFAKLENLLLSIGVVDYGKFNADRDALIASRDSKQLALNGIIHQLNNPNSFNDYLGTKCLARLHEADYETLSPVNLVHFSLKAKVLCVFKEELQNTEKQR